MGLLENIRKKTKVEKQVDQYFKMMNGYSPVFKTFEGSVYEMELTRASIHAFATHCSKLKPEVNGKNNAVFERSLQYRPNPYMNTSQYLYKLATLYMVKNTAFIIPLYDDYMQSVVGYYPLNPSAAEIVEQRGKKYLKFSMPGGTAALELDRVGYLNQFLLKSDVFGESNSVMYPTLELMNTNNQGIIEGVKNSAYIRFIAKLAMTLSPKDMEAEKKRLIRDNLSADNNGGVMLIDQKYENIEQVDSKQFTVDAEQLKVIKDNVFDYFGTNENILQNKFTSSEWSAYYEGKIEPFAIQASLTHTNMTFTENELSYGNSIVFTTNRVQYMDPQEKLSMVTQLFDRGFITHNQGLEVFNMDGIGEDGDKRYIRKEYAQVDLYEKEQEQLVLSTEVGGNADEPEQTV